LETDPARVVVRQDVVVLTELKLFADYHQVHVFDEGAVTDLGEAWTEQASLDRLAVGCNALAIGTEVNVYVLVAPGDPGLPPDRR
jgi:hypothetical protein